MENDNKKKEQPNIDEAYLMQMMANGVQKEGLQIPTDPPAEPMKEKPANKEKNRSKKIAEAEYEKLFFRNPDSNARNGKSVYIRPEFHERLTRIVQVIGEDKLTIYAYLDNVLEYHFQEFGEQITIAYNDKYKPIL